VISRAIILAAGHGKRMRPLTEHTPKPLLSVGGKTLIETHIEQLRDGGVSHIIINTGRLGQQFENKLGNGKYYGVNLTYSHEGDEPLETGGGIVNALPLFDDEFFIAINGDIWTDYDYSLLRKRTATHCHLVLVNNPEHNPQGDFAFSKGRVSNMLSGCTPCFTFSGIAVYARALFKGATHTAFPLTPLLRQAVDNAQASAERYTGKWFDIGTPQRLTELDQLLLKPKR